MLYIIDRFEEDAAVLENSETLGQIITARDLLPEGAKEGDALREENGGWFLCPDETEARKARIKIKMNRLMKK